jgi:hypothetical protein
MMLLQESENQIPKADLELCSFTEPRPSKDNPVEGWTPQELAAVRSRIVLHWGREPEKGFEVSVMLRARGASAKAVCQLLDGKFANKKLRVGGRWAPKSQNWFLTVIENEFNPGHLPEPAASPSNEEQQIDQQTLNRGIEAIELADAARSIVESVNCNHCGRAALVEYTDGTVEGCGCRQKAPGGLKRVQAISVPGAHSSAGARRRSGGK